jgi:hypothetical protein
MRAKRDRWILVAMVAVLACSVPLTSAARGFGRGFGRGGPGGGPGGPRGGLVERLIFPCRADCHEAGHACFETAKNDAVTCAQASCDAPIQAARTACTANPGGTDCTNARAALLECVDPCQGTARTALMACREAVGSCLTGCGDAGEGEE